MAIKPHRYDWLIEPLENLDTVFLRAMFGCKAVYLYGKLVVVLAAHEEPWRGLLFPAERERHPSIQKEFPVLKSHPILGKWLYLSESNDDFEQIGSKIIELIRNRDPRFGTEPKAKKSKAKTFKKKKKR